MIVAWLAMARAQDVVFEDFDGAPPLMYTSVGYASVATPPTAHDGQALRIQPVVSPDYGYGLVSLGDAPLMTHTRVGLDALADDAYPGQIHVIVWPNGYAPDLPFFQVELTDRDWALGDGDTSAVCGQEFTLDLLALTGNPYQHGHFETADTGLVFVPSVVEYWLDNLALTGPICDVFLDRDGDGGCPQGIDLDGNGDCIGAGEPLAYGEVYDVDDTPVPETADTGAPSATGDTGATPADTADTALGEATGGTGAPPLPEDTGPPPPPEDTSPPPPEDTSPPSTTGDTASGATADTSAGTAPTDTSAPPPPDTSSGTTPPPTDGTPDPDHTGGDSGAAGKGCGCAGSGSRGAGAALIVLALVVPRRRRASPRC